MSEPDLQAIHDLLVETAKEAGQMITSAKPNTADASEKKNAVDLVTETDQAVEKFISEKLKNRYPDYEFIGEETYQPGMQVTNAPTFICDPIDGTTNFIHAHPYISISLGFTLNRTPSVGIVYNPFTETLYSAITGHGAFVNLKTRLPLTPPSSLPNLSKALIILEGGSDREGQNFDCKMKTFRTLLEGENQGGKMIHGFRSFGSAALNLCNVASGGCDIYWEGGCWAWDVCAGWVILKEAGGVIVDGNPTGDWNIPVDHRKYLAVRATEDSIDQKTVVAEFWGAIQGEMSYSS